MPASEQEEARVLHHVREALARAPEVIALDLGIEVVGGLVTLTGTVDTLEQKLAAGHVAASAPGVRLVENKLAVTTQGEVREVEIEAGLDQAAAQAGGLPGMYWELEDGVVTLHGVTDSIASAEQATEAMAEVVGVKEVERELEVVGMGLPQDDASLRNRVELALHEDTSTGYLPVEVAVEGGVVTLSGRVADLEGRHRVEQVVRAVPGVGHLVNVIEPQTGETGGVPGLEAAVMAALAAAPDLDERRLLVNVVDGTVYLAGQVRDEENRFAAERVAAAVAGVFRVHNDIQVVSEFR